MNKITATLKPKKVVLIGAGAVGTSFIYSAVNRGLANYYEIIDVFENAAIGNKLDIEDAIATCNQSFQIEVGSYEKCKDADLIVITAGLPQKPGQTRMDLVLANAKIMQGIALEIKKSGFNGITLIASNPVDVLTTIYQNITQFPTNKVIGSGTSLDSARLKVEISKHIGVSPKSIDAYVIGEHGDSSVSVFSCTSVNGISLNTFAKNKLIDPKLYNEIHEIVYKKAYEIIAKKRATFYGIGSALAQIANAVLNNTKEVLACGGYLDNHYMQKGIYTGVPAVIGSNGIENILELELNATEKNKFKDSCKFLADVVKKTLIELKK